MFDNDDLNLAFIEPVNITPKRKIKSQIEDTHHRDKINTTENSFQNFSPINNVNKNIILFHKFI